MESITAQIKEHIDSVTAVLVLVNGTVPGVSVGTSHTLSTLSDILPRTLPNNIAVVLTNVSSPLYRNFSQNDVPEVIKDAPLFLLNNPIALQKKFLELKRDPNMKKGKANWRNAVMAAEQNALEMLVGVFDWLDSLRRQPATGVVSLPEKPQSRKARITNLLATMGQSAAKKARNASPPVSGPPRLPLAFESYPRCSRM